MSNNEEEGEEDEEGQESRNAMQSSTNLLATGGMPIDNQPDLDGYVQKFSWIWLEAQQQLGVLPPNHWTTCILCKVQQMENKSILDKGGLARVYEYYFDNCSKTNEMMLANEMSKRFEKYVRRVGNENLEIKKWNKVRSILFQHKVSYDHMRGLKGLEDIEMDEEPVRKIEMVIKHFDSLEIIPLKSIIAFAHFRLHTVELPFTQLRKARNYLYADFHFEQQLNFLTPDNKIGIDNNTFKNKSKNDQVESKFYCSKFENALFVPNLSAEGAIRTALAGTPQALGAMNPSAKENISQMTIEYLNLYGEHVS